MKFNLFWLVKWLLSWVWRFLSEIKNLAYNSQLIRPTQIPYTVMSIGNLTMGGTGKTPAIMQLTEALQDQYRVAVICKSYKAGLKEPAKVDLEMTLPVQMYGDEAVLMQRLLPRVQVFSGPKKLETALFAVKSDPRLDILLLDDGFQHRRLARNCDIVILDATEPLVNYQCFPLGRGREKMKSLRRADIILITKMNLATEQSVQLLKDFLPANIPVFESDFVAEGIDEWVLSSETFFMEPLRRPLESLKDRQMVAVAGIGNPEGFYKSLKNLGVFPHHQLSFADHYDYQLADVKEILKHSQDQIILTTAKDAVKLVRFKKELSFRLLILSIRLDLKGKTQQYVSAVKDVTFRKSQINSGAGPDSNNDK